MPGLGAIDANTNYVAIFVMTVLIIVSSSSMAIQHQSRNIVLSGPCVSDENFDVSLGNTFQLLHKFIPDGRKLRRHRSRLMLQLKTTL